MHHIIDPNTGNPVQTDLISASVLAPDATRAEAWATAMMVSGSGEAIQLMEEARVSGLLVSKAGNMYLTGSFNTMPGWQVPVIGSWDQQLERMVYYAVTSS